MLLRISLIIAILAGIGTIVITQLKTREHVQTIITARNTFETEKKAQIKRADKAETELASTKEVLNQTKGTLTKTEEQLNGANQQLASAQEALGKVKTELTKAIDERKVAQADLAKWDILGIKPEQVVEMKANLQKTKDVVVALEDEKKILNNQVAALDNQLKRLLGIDYVVVLPPGSKGNVLTVDPKWNFVVLDMGKDKGMLEGGILLVHRHSQLVGKVQINEVQGTRCIANVMPGWSLGEIEEGDQVIY